MRLCKEMYEDINEKTGKDQYLVPVSDVFTSGSTLKDAIELAEYVRDIGYMPEQVQDFIDSVNDFDLYVLYRC